MYNELLAKANKELAKVVAYIKEHESMFDMMDLKLHDASYYCWKDMEKDFSLCAESGIDYFAIFCECEYDCFIEWCTENNIDFDKMMHRVGRTSKFYLHDWNDVNMDFMLYNIVNEIGYWYTCDYITVKNGVIISTEIEQYKEDTIESLEYFANELWNDFSDAIDDMIRVYEYISDFKKNQIDYFKDFLASYEEGLEYEKEEEERQIKESAKFCSDIQNKYSISDEDMDILQYNIHNWNC